MTKNNCGRLLTRQFTVAMPLPTKLPEWTSPDKTY